MMKSRFMGNTVNKTLVTALALAFALAFTAALFAVPSNAVQAAPAAKIAIVFATGGLGDKSFNDSAYEGIKAAQSRLNIDYRQAEPQAVAEYESFLTQFARTGQYDLIISIGFDQADALKSVATRFPKQKFAIVDMVVDAPNVASYIYKEQERGFVLGAIAGLMTQRKGDPRINPDNVIGVIGGMDIPLINANIAGYIAGAKYVNPDVKVLYSYVGGWADPGKGKELTLAQFDQGADIVWLAAGRSGLGGIKAASEKNRYAFGADADQGYLAPKNILSNGMKYVNNTVFRAIEDVVKDRFKPGIHLLGLKEKGLGYSESLVPKDVMGDVEKLAAKVASGDLDVPDKISEVDAWLAKNKKK